MGGGIRYSEFTGLNIMKLWWLVCYKALVACQDSRFNWMLIPLCIMWSSCHERNRKCFEGKEENAPIVELSGATLISESTFKIIWCFDD